MDVRAAVPRHNRDNKPGNAVAAQGRNRTRVLRDIGNLTIAPPVEANKLPTQTNRPLNKTACAQLLKNARAAEVEKNQKKPPLSELVNERVAALKAQNKVVIPKKGDENNHPSAVEKTFTEKPSKKKGKAFTSVLTARSKAVSEITHVKPKEPIVDIDAEDVNNELAMHEYVDDIYQFYKQSENESRVFDYMSAQTDINSKMRSILVDWLVEVHCKFELMPETLYLTVHIIDRYLSVKAVARKEFQLLGISSMLIACKYEEIWAPEVNDFVCVSAKAYTREQVLAMEKLILEKLKWQLTVPTPYVFLVRYIKASASSDPEVENMAFFLAELGLMHYSTVALYRPSTIAAAAVYAARCTIDKKSCSPTWTETLRHHTSYSEDQLMECAKLLVGFHAAVAESKLKAVHKKFSEPALNSVALLAPVRRLAASP